MESWRRAWDGEGPVKPYKDLEWMEWRHEWLSSLPSGEGMSNEVAAENYRHVQAQWMIDRVDEIEQVAPELAATIRESMS